MRVHHFNGGTMRPIGGKLIDGKPGLLRRSEMVCHCLLIETDTELVLVDTGVGTRAVENAAEWLGGAFVRLVGLQSTAAESAVAAVRGLGHDPADVRHVVLTHLDLDHAGGLADFPQATVHVHATELRALRSPRDMAERIRYRRAQFQHGPQWMSYSDAGDPWFGFEAVRELKGLPPEILLVPLAGHTRGHAGVAVRSDDGWLLNAGDAYFFHGELDVRPHCPPGLALFERGVQTVAAPRRANQERLRTLRRDHPEVQVFCAHDPVELTAG